MGRAFPYSLVVASTEGLTTVADWAALPASPDEGALALTEDDGALWEWRTVSGDGFWLPASVTLGGTVAYRVDVDAELCRLRLADAAYPATWLQVGATKSAGNPLAIAGGAGTQYLAAEMPVSAGGLYLLRVVPTALGVGVAWVAYQSGEGEGSNLLPGTYVTPSAAVVGSLSGAVSGAGGDSVPSAGRPVFLVHDDRGAARQTVVIVPGYGVTHQSSSPRSAIAATATPYFGTTNLSGTGFSLDYIGAFDVT